MVRGISKGRPCWALVISRAKHKDGPGAEPVVRVVRQGL